MFHVKDGLYFGRMNGEGDVRVLQFNGHHTPPNANGVYSSVNVSLDKVIPAGSWASTIASVSQLGETGLRFYAAQAFHNDRVEQPHKTEIAARPLLDHIARTYQALGDHHRAQKIRAMTDAELPKAIEQMTLDMASVLTVYRNDLADRVARHTGNAPL